MDLQLNIFAPPKAPKPKLKVPSNKTDGYSFVSNPVLIGKTIARKRRKDVGTVPELNQQIREPPQKLPKRSDDCEDDLAGKLRDLSENKGKYKNKNYQDLTDEIQIKSKPRSGGWVSSLFKNNPDVPKIGQRLVKPIVEKVFSGKTFTDLIIHPHSVANLEQNLKLKELTTVQQKSCPVILQGRDVLIRSQTGSGKTLAYALPLIEGLQAIRPKIHRHDGIRAVIVVPTRELAVQTYELFVKLVKPFSWIVPGLLSGGQKRKAEKARLRKGLSILVGTPGRINDHLRHTQALNFAKTRCLILDEADRLLDMGYEKDVAAIVEALETHKKNATYDPMAMIKKSVKNFDENKEEQAKNGDQEVKHHLTEVLLSDERQTVLLSATLTKAVENLAGLTMIDPVFIDTSEGSAVIVADSLNVSKPSTEKGSNEQKMKSPKIREKNEGNDETDKLNARNSITDEEVTKDKKRIGLKEFNGSKFLELFKPLGSTEAPDIKHISNVSGSQNSNKYSEKVTEHSDSDSDYEYFKVQKQLSTQKNESPPELGQEEAEEKNKFQEALQNAVEEDELVIPVSVQQKFMITPMKLRLVTLCAMIVEHCILNKKSGKMVVFMATTEMVDYHAKLLEAVLTGRKEKKRKGDKEKKTKKAADDGSDESSAEEVDSDFELPKPGELGLDGLVPVELQLFALHGSMPHSTRMDVFNRFRGAKSALLLCTDVAARGLDLPRVDLVLQYCAPASATDYVHRVGRTGRATNVGAATLLLLPSEAEFVRYLEEKRIRLSQANERTVLESLRTLAPTASNSARAAIATQASLEHTANSSKEWLAAASRAYTSWVRFYAAYPRPVKSYFDNRALHLGHAAKSFALRDTPGAVARRVKNNPTSKERPGNRLTVDKEKDKRRPGFPKSPLGAKRWLSAKQSSMHTASEFDSGLEPLPKKKSKLHN